MGLNLTVGGGEEFTPFIKMNAKFGRWYIPGDGKDAGDIEILGPVLALDFATIRTGWGCYPSGRIPIYVWDVNDERGPKPANIGSQEFREGFQIICYVSNTIPGTATRVGLREWSSTANAVKQGVIEAYEKYEAEKGKYPGMTPVFKVVGVQKISGQSGDNFAPVFEFVKWVNEEDIPGLIDMRMEWVAEQVKAMGMTPANQEALAESIGESQVPPVLDDDIPF